MKQAGLLLLNSITLAAALVMNYLSGLGKLNGNTVSDISKRYETLFTPAGYAFAIWGIIYIFLIAFVIHQWYAWYRKKDDQDLRRTGVWFAIGNIANGLWIWAWTGDSIGWSVLLIILLLLSLAILVVRLRLEIPDAPLRIIAFVWWPVCIYLGWIVVASAANIAVYLKSTNQTFFLTEETRAIALIILAALIYVLLIYFRNMREAALVGIWAFIAIAVRQWEHHIHISFAAILASVILFIYVGYHGYKNRETSPFRKIQSSGNPMPGT